MKILCDFDGVLTDLTEEAKRAHEIFIELVTKKTGLPRPGVIALLEGAERELKLAPLRHGWSVAGRLSAYADEDHFIHNTALAACLDGGEGKASDFSFCELAQAAYEQMLEETAQGDRNPLDPAAGATLAELVHRGVEVVVVSNSGTDRIARLLRAAGLAPDTAGLRVRGDAGKFRLGGNVTPFPLGDRQVDLDRPSYRAILLEEIPSVVVGDVLSLDLALPLALAEQGVPGFRGIRLLLRRRPYTPQWTLDYLNGRIAAQDAQSEVSFGILDGIQDLLRLV